MQADYDITIIAVNRNCMPPFLTQEERFIHKNILPVNFFANAFVLCVLQVFSSVFLLFSSLSGLSKTSIEYESDFAMMICL